MKPTYEDIEKTRSGEPEPECDHEWGEIWKTYVNDPPKLETRCIHCGAYPRAGEAG